MDQRGVSDSWRRRGFDCHLWVDPPGQCWENFRHGVDELLMVLAGDLEVEIETVTLYPAPGEEVMIPAGARHSVRNRGGIPARWLFGYRDGGANRAC